MLEAPEKPRSPAGPRVRPAARMSRLAVVVFGLAAAASGFAAGCEARCPTQSCPTSHVDVHALDDSTVTWTFRDAPPEMATGFVPDPPSGSDCSFSFMKGSVDPGAAVSSAEAGADRVYPGSVIVSCAGGGRGEFEFIITPPGDLREWSTGTFTLVAGGGGTREIDPPASGCQVGYLNGLTMTVTVEEAVGGSAPFPKLVTSDFLRTFRLDLDTSTLMPKGPTGEACDFPLTGQLSLHLTQTAADYIADPYQQCLCL